MSATLITNVSSIIMASGGWDWGPWRNCIPMAIQNQIHSVPLPVAANASDSLCWAPNGSGKFSIGSCYNFILMDNNWDWLWKLKIPFRIITFLWTLVHNKILTNQNCVLRNISTNPFCKKCSHIESAEHIFKRRACAIIVWE